MIETMNTGNRSCSVVMVCHNAMPYIRDAVESILGQTRRDFELIIVNDGSTDDTTGYLNSVRQRDSRVIVFDQVKQGQQVAANCGISHAKTDLIVRMDADDIADPRRLEFQVKYMEQHPKIGLLGSQIRRMGNQHAGMESNFPCDHDNIVKMLLKNRHSMCNPSTIFRKSIFDELGGYWEHDIAEDWDLFLRISEVAELANLPQVLLSYRFHRGSINGQRIVEAQIYNEYAADAAARRRQQQPAIDIHTFKNSHRSRRWPASWMFYADALSIGQYREAIAEIYDGRWLRGYLRLTLASIMSPTRTLRRLINMVSGQPHPET